MGMQFFSSHLRFLERSKGSSLLFGMKSGVVRSVSRLFAFKAKPFFHIFGSFFGGHEINVHCVDELGEIAVTYKTDFALSSGGQLCCLTDLFLLCFAFTSFIFFFF